MRPRVLVIDDDRLIAAAIRRTLQRECEVVVEDDPSAALATLCSGARFDVILCDLAMPTLSGLGFYHQLAGSHPDLAARIVFVAGSYVDHPMEDISNRRLGKPYQPEMLRQVVREVASGE